MFSVVIIISGGSRPSDKWASGHLDPEIKEGNDLQKNFVDPCRASFGLKIKGGPGRPDPSPGSATDYNY